MHRRSLSELSTQIDSELAAGASGNLVVAFSGGLDSTVLLHAIAAQRNPKTVRVIHVNHGLHADAARWAAQCSNRAAELQLDFQSHAVSVPTDSSDGLESAARRVRYEALRSTLHPGETLLTAHHADDQLETVFLALLRGSGVDGLAAMPRCQRFGQGWHLRPLLGFTREDLLSWAREQKLAWLEDPSNDNRRFDRNFLRNELTPTLRKRWPSAPHTVSRSASHLAEAGELLDELAAHDFASSSVGMCLRVASIAALSPARRRNLLRYWLRSCCARTPSTRKLAALENDMLFAAEDRIPCVGWDEVEVRRYRGLMYCIPRTPSNARIDQQWDWRKPLELGVGSGLLRAEIAHGRGFKRAMLPTVLRMASRQGGERIRLPGHAHHRELKKLLQEANVLPWWRDRVPLLFDGETLVGVADLWIASAYAAQSNEEGVQLHWERRPQLVGLS